MPTGAAGEPAVKKAAENRLFGNTVVNLVGNVAPLACAVVAIPRVIRGLGTDRFGVVTLVWMFVGYFSLFDFGLGRALTRSIAEAQSRGEEDQVPALVWTGLALMIGFGVVGGGILSVVAPYLVERVLRVPEAIRIETLEAFRALAFLIPLVTSMTALQGVLEARQLFLWSNAVRIPLGMFAYLGPLLALTFSKSVLSVVGMLAIGRALGWMAFFGLCLKALPSLRLGIRMERKFILPLIRFGGWMTITNVVGPLMVYIDRFFIGALASVAVVAYYTTPYEVLIKFHVLPSSVVGVLFPAFAASFAVDRTRTVRMFERGLGYVALMMLPLALVVSAFAKEGLALWLGLDFPERSSAIVEWLILGIFVTGVSYVPFWVLHGIGRPELPAKAHLCELPVYLIALVLLVRAHGPEGAAIAWTLRGVLDAALLFFLVPAALPGSRSGVRRFLPLLLFAVVLLVGARVPDGVGARVVYVALACALYAFATYRIMLDEVARADLRAMVGRLRGGSQ